MIYYLGAFLLTSGGAAIGLAALIEGARAQSRAATLAGALMLIVAVPLQFACVWKMVGGSVRTVTITPALGAVLVAPPSAQHTRKS